MARGKRDVLRFQRWLPRANIAATDWRQMPSGPRRKGQKLGGYARDSLAPARHLALGIYKLASLDLPAPFLSLDVYQPTQSQTESSIEELRYVRRGPDKVPCKKSNLSPGDGG